MDKVHNHIEMKEKMYLCNDKKNNIMTENQKRAIIESGKDYFRTSIVPNHIKNLNKL